MGESPYWLWQHCPSSPTCPQVGRLGDRTLVQGYPITDPELLAEVPDGEVLSWLPADKGITVRLDEAALGAFVMSLRTEAFRHEVLASYDVGSDDAVRRYLSGADPDPHTGADWRAWIREQVDNGRTLRTLRVVHDSPGDYLRYECEWGYTANRAAGMDIRVLDLTERPAPQGFADEEFWLVDDDRVAVMRYDATGRFLYADLVEGAAAHRYITGRDAAWDAAESFASWWNLHPEYQRRQRHSV